MMSMVLLSLPMRSQTTSSSSCQVNPRRILMRKAAAVARTMPNWMGAPKAVERKMRTPTRIRHR